MTSVSPQKWPDQLVIVRHGTSVRNEAKAQPDARDFGCGMRDFDVPLTDSGVKQALAVGGEFKCNWDFDIIYSSPYLRCQETANFIKGSMGTSAPIVLDDRLRGVEWGIWDGLSRDEIARRHPALWAKRQRDKKFSFRPPCGESWFDVAQRLRGFLAMLVRESPGKRVLVVTHSVSILVLRYLVERQSEQAIMQIEQEEDVHNCSVTEYQFDAVTGRAGRLLLKQFNSIYYYEKDCFNEAAKQRREMTLRQVEIHPKPPEQAPPPELNTREDHEVVYEARVFTSELVEAALRLAKKKNNSSDYVNGLVEQVGNSPGFIKLAKDLVKYVAAEPDKDKRILIALACLGTAFATGVEASEMQVWGTRKPQ